jgi:hypothetical protein
MKRLQVFCILALLCCLPVVLANAQSASTAQISGTVVDPQGAVVPGATVTATNTATGVPRSVNTTSTGNYVIPNLTPGTYDVKVQAKGFGDAVSKSLKLNVGDQQTLNFNMAVAGSSQTVEVTAEAPLIETTKTDVSTSVTDVEMQKLPTFAAITGGANDYASLALTAPGVKLDTSTLTGDLVGPGSINNRANLYNVDGANITDQLVSGRDGLGAAVDEIQEFQVLTNSYNAEYGQAGGLIINAVTKSGTNQFHGDGHMYFRGRNLQASNPFYNLSLVQSAIPQSAPPTGIGGPPRCPDSDFTGGTLTSIAGCPRVPFHRKEGGFTFGGPLMKDKLFFFTSYELSRQGAPLILTPDTGVVAVPQPINNLLWSGKIDYRISEKHLLTARYNVDRILQDNLIIQTSNSVSPDDLTSNVAHVNAINVSLVSTLRPNLVNEARFVAMRTLTSTPDKTDQPGVIHSDGTITGANFCCPQGGLNKRYQYIDNVSLTHGNHNYKTGFNISYYPWFSLFPQFHFGQYVVNASNVPQSFTFAVGPGEVTSKDNIYGFYVQDTWKLFHNFTLNYGVRYDFEAGAFKGGKIHGPNGTCFQGNGLISACSSDGNNWQPRVGFTWQVFKDTQFKASFAEVTMLAFNNVVLDSLNFDGTTLNTVTVDGSTPAGQAVLNAFPNAPSPALLAAVTPPPGSSFGRVRPISDHLKNPEIRMFNAGIQHQFSKSLVGEVQYIGQFGFGLFGERDTNAPPVLPDPAHPGFFFFGNRPDPHFTAVRTNENSRTSHYNGLLASVTKRLANHFSVNASYTWSHAITSSEDFFGISEPGDYVNVRPELGPAFNDVRHAVNFGVVFDSGRWTDANIVRWFTNDVNLGFIGQFQSGRPYPVSTGTAGFTDGRFFGAGSETQQRPVVLPDGTLSTAGIASFDGSNALFGPGAVTECINAGNPAALCNSLQNTFVAPAGASAKGARDSLHPADVVDFQLVNGNLERNAGRTDPFARLDMSAKKTFRIPHTESVRLELQADALNVLNHANYQGFIANDVTNLVTFGALTPTPDPTQNFFTCTSCMRPNGTIIGSNGQPLNISNLRNGKVSSNLLAPLFGGIGDPTTADGSRLFQLSFHVRF